MPRHAAKLVLILAVLASVAQAAVSCGSAVSAAQNATSSTLSTTGNNIIIAGTVGFGSITYSVDSLGNYYNWMNGYGVGAAPNVVIGYAQTIGSETLQTSASTTFNFLNGQASAAANNNTDPAGIYYACSGLVGSYPTIVTGSAAASGAATFAETSTAVNPGDLVYTCAGTNGATFTAAINQSFSTPTVVVPAANDGIACSFLVVGAGVTSVNPTWTMSANTDWRWTTVVFPGCGAPCGELAPATFGPTSTLVIGKQGGPGNGAGQGSLPYADSCTAANAIIFWPTQMVFAKTGLLVWADLGYNAIRAYNPTAASIVEYGQTVGVGCTVLLAGQAANAGASYNYATSIAGTSALFAHPVGVAIDPSDNIFIADQQNNVIAKLSTSGQVSVVAGSGPAQNGACNNGSFAGDGGAATSASLNCPQGVAVVTPATGGGYLLAILDGNNRAIRLVNLTGSSFSGFGISGLANGNITTIVGHNGAGCSTSGAGTSGTITGVAMGVTSYNGDVYYPDSSCFHFVKDAQSNGQLSLFAGNGSQGYAYGNATSACEFQQPFDLRFDSNGVAYATDQLGAQIVMVKNGVCSLLAGSPAIYGTKGGIGPIGAPSRLSALGGGWNGGQAGPISAQPDNQGNLWIPDTGNNRILKVNVPCYGTCVQ